MPIIQTTSNEPVPGPGLRVRLAPGTELLGQWQGSAYRVAPYLIRRADGQHLQVSRLLYQLADSVQSTSAPDELASRLSRSTGRDISVDNVVHLLRTKLVPLGILTEGEEVTKPAERADPLLGLRFRAGVVPAGVHRRVSGALTFLFWPPLVALALAGLAGADVWLGVSHGAGVLGGVGQIIAHPALVLALVSMSLAGAVIHETGHAAATRAGGATPGVMGAGLYLIWPVFYTDISDSYRLGRAGRLRADLGGVYFNALTLLLASAAYGLTHWSVLLVFIAVTHLEVLTQFLPFVRLDGYWVVSDLVGVPNLFAYLGPTLAHLLGRADAAAENRLAQIKPWARRVITVWVVATAAVLAVNLVMVAWVGPHLVAETVGAVGVRGRQMASAFALGRVVLGADDLFSILFLALPAAGIFYIGMLLLRGAVRGLLRWRTSRPLVALVCATALAALAGYQAYSMAASYVWPHSRPPAAERAAAAVPPDRASDPAGTGTWTVQKDGSVTATGSARFYGSASGLALAAPTVAIAATPDGRGYWLAGSDGGVFAFGDARFYGSVAMAHLAGPVVSIQATSDGRGYWLSAADGGVFAFGDARFYGSLAGLEGMPRIVGLAAAAGDHGYWLAGSDGAVFAVGPADYLGRTVAGPGNPVRAIDATSTGYELLVGHRVVALRPATAPRR